MNGGPEAKKMTTISMECPTDLRVPETLKSVAKPHHHEISVGQVRGNPLIVNTPLTNLCKESVNYFKHKAERAMVYQEAKIRMLTKLALKKKGVSHIKVVVE